MPKETKTKRTDLYPVLRFFAPFSVRQKLGETTVFIYDLMENGKKVRFLLQNVDKILSKKRILQSAQNFVHFIQNKNFEK
jgi:hypothetical protein